MQGEECLRFSISQQTTLAGVSFRKHEVGYPEWLRYDLSKHCPVKGATNRLKDPVDDIAVFSDCSQLSDERFDYEIIGFPDRCLAR
jgi:hypothetical protein